MAYLTKTRFGYYVNRDFILPTPVGDAIVGAAARGRQRMGFYASRNFVLPTSSDAPQNQALVALAQASKHACGCSGICGHGGKQYKRPVRRLGRLGDDSYDITDLGPPVDNPILGPVTTNFPPSPDQTTTFSDLLNNPNAYGNIFTPTNPNSGTVYGPPAAGQPGSTASSATSSIASAVGNVISSIFRPSASTGTLTAAQQAALAQQSPLTAPISGIGLSPLALGAIGLGAIVLISAMKGGKRR